MAVNLGSAASKGAAYTVGAQLVRILIMLTSVMLLSRLLSPAEFGLVAMVMAVVGVGDVLRDFGLTQAAVQAKSLSDSERNNLWWINAFMGFLVTVMFFGLAGPISMFYDEPVLVDVTQLLSLIFLLNGLSTQYKAGFIRALRFKALAVIEITAQAVGLLVGVSLAVYGVGLWALVAMQLTTPVATLGLVLVVGRWVPGLYDTRTPVNHFISFGGYLVLAKVVFFFSKSAGPILVGRLLGPVPAGIYNRAFQTLVVPLNQINAPSSRVALPILSRLLNDPPQFKKFLRAGQSLLMNSVLTLFALVAIYADLVVRVMLGPGWGDVVVLVQILAISGVFQTAGYVTYWIFLATANSRSYLFFRLSCQPLVVIGVASGIPWGVEGVAWGYTIGTALLWPLSLFWAKRFAMGSASALLKDGVTIIVTFTVATLPCLWVGHLLADQVSEASIRVVQFVYFTGCLVLIFTIWPAFRQRVAEGPRVLRNLRR